jgi:hypothetical protein
MKSDEMEARLLECEKLLVAHANRLSALEAWHGNQRYGIASPEMAASGRGKGGTTELALSRLKQPREIAEGMANAVGTGMVQTLVDDRKR